MVRREYGKPFHKLFDAAIGGTVRAETRIIGMSSHLSVKDMELGSGNECDRGKRGLGHAVADGNRLCAYRVVGRRIIRGFRH